VHEITQQKELPSLDIAVGVEIGLAVTFITLMPGFFQAIYQSRQ
jgi:hypothetical protein